MCGYRSGTSSRTDSSFRDRATAVACPRSQAGDQASRSACRDHGRAGAPDLREVLGRCGLPIELEPITPGEGAVGIGGPDPTGQCAASGTAATARAPGADVRRPARRDKLIRLDNVVT